MTPDELKVNAILAELDAKRKVAEKREYDFFFLAPAETQEMYYQYWLANCGDKAAPRFLQDYEKSKDSTPPVFLWPPVPF